MAGERILIADDEAEARHQCRVTLEGAGYQVLEAAEAAEMVTLAQAHRPQLLLVDLLMPGMDGFEAIATLRQHAAGATLPILYLSTLAPQEVISQGVARYLTKPFERETVIQAVRALAPPPRGGAPTRVLVADDERDIVEILCDYLEDAGFLGVGVYDGQEAIAAIERQSPGALILDIKMPGVDGYGVIRWVKRHPVHRRLPIIVLTATKLLRIDHQLPGHSEPLFTVPKPCPPAQLLAAVQERLHAA